MSRRFLALLALLFLAALLAGWLWHRGSSGHVELPRAEGEPGNAASSPIRADRDEGRSSATEKGGSGFEPLSSTSGDVLLQFRDVTTLAPVPAADVFVLEGTEPGWPTWESLSDKPAPDLEADLRSRGQRAVGDEHGDLLLRSPRFPLRVTGRKGELFGAECIGAEDARPVPVWMYRSTACTVHVRDPQGRPVPDAPIEIGTRSNDDIWRGRCDGAGDCRIANLSWLLRYFGDDEGWWYAGVEGSRFAQAIAWYWIGDPVPSAIELELPPASRVTFQIAASDGTPVPVAGSVRVLAPAFAGQERPPLAHRDTRGIPIVRGEAAVELGEPGGWVDCAFQLGDGVDFLRSVRMPERASSPASILLRVPEGVQILIGHPVDVQGEPLRGASFEWVVSARGESDGLGLGPLVDSLQSDKDGMLVFAVPQKLLAGDHWSSPQGRLCLRDGKRGLECPPVWLSKLGSAAVCDLGKLVIGPARALARGRILDDLGQPIPGVLVRLHGVPLVDGRPDPDRFHFKTERCMATTDADGRFQLFGEVLERQVRLDPWMSGYSLPRDATLAPFDPSSPPELSITLVRNGEIRTCVILAEPLARRFHWNPMWFELGPKDGAGRIERDIRNVQPGTYRLQLVDNQSPEIVLADVDGVVVRPGERTNDPRLCGIDLSHAAALLDTRTKTEMSAGSIVLDVLDAGGKPIPDGRILPMGFARDAYWHAGHVILDPSARGQEIAVWSPGFRAWIGACPESSTKLRLERSPRLTLRVEIPPAMQRPDCRFRIWPEAAGGSNMTLEMIRSLKPVELDAEGVASFECPAECTVRFIVQMLAVDATGSLLREGATPEPVTGLDVELPTVDESQTITASPEEWANIEKILAGGR